MNKFVVISTVVLCFIFYGIWPLAASSLLIFISDEPIVAIVSVALWSAVVLVQVIAMWQIFKKNVKWLHVFFSTIFLYIGLLAAGEIIVYLESEANAFPFYSILNKAIFPLLAGWALYFSDAKNFFTPQLRVRYE